MNLLYKSIFTLSIFLTISSSLLAQDFYLNDNGVTCMCPDASVGDTGVVNGVTYTKRTANQITEENASSTCTSGIMSMANLFEGMSSFNEDLSSWDVSDVESFERMFYQASSFDGDIGSWDVSSAQTFSWMFRSAQAFNGDISNWDTSSAILMDSMFSGAITFNQELDNWDVSDVESFEGMFSQASSFNGGIGGWDVSSAHTFSWMFRNAQAFNGDVSNWDTSSAILMDGMFSNAINFNQDLGDWDVSNVEIFEYMFIGATLFNQDIGGWNVSTSLNFGSMFYQAYNFDQDLSDWVFDPQALFFYTEGFINESGLSVLNYEKLLESFSNQNLTEKTLLVSNLEYCNSFYRDDLLNNKGWDIYGDEQIQSEITAPSDLEIQFDEMSCVATGIDLGEPTVNDLCGSISIVNDAPLEFSIGQTEVTWTLTDNNGVETTDVQIVTLSYSNPLIFAPNGISVESNSGLCVATDVELGEASFVGGCGNITIENDAPSEYELGETEVTWTLVDGQGNEASDVQIVNVTYIEPSIVAPTSIEIEANLGECVATNVELGEPVVSGGCGNIIIENDAPSEYGLGETEVTWMLTDGQGNESESIQIVNVNLSVDISEICYVTSDEEEENKNRIFISYSDGLNVDYYDVLRETSSAGVFQSVGVITPPETSLLDTSSENDSQNYRYILRTRDICGQTSSDSVLHTTILLQSNIATDNSVNLNWNAYEGLGYSTFNVFRKVNDDPYELLTSLASSTLTFSDTEADVEANSYEYYISIDVGDCAITRNNSSLESNREFIDSTLNLDGFTNYDDQIIVYPNPFEDVVFVKSPNTLLVEGLIVYSITGQVITRNSSSSLSLASLESGMYFVKIITSKGDYTKRIIKK